jgi:uncharacterized protein (TIGR00106 family)
MELTVIPMGRGASVSEDIAELVGIIDESGMPYRVTALGTLIEGAWDELMNLVKDCHAAARKNADRVILLMKLEDYAGRTDLLTGTVGRVEKRLGRTVNQ